MSREWPKCNHVSSETLVTSLAWGERPGENAHRASRCCARLACIADAVAWVEEIGLGVYVYDKDNKLVNR